MSMFNVFSKKSKKESKKSKSWKSPEPSVEDSVVSEDTQPKEEDIVLVESAPPKTPDPPTTEPDPPSTPEPEPETEPETEPPVVVEEENEVKRNGHEIKVAVDKARDALEHRLKEALAAMEHSRNEHAIADSEFDRLCQEEAQAKDIYESAPATMERYVKSSLKQYWRLAQKRKKAATRTKAASDKAVEEARDNFEWTLKDALEKVDKARAGELTVEAFDKTAQASNVEDYDITDDDGSPSFIAKYSEDRPSRMFGNFDAKAYLERMEEEATDIETDDEGGH